MIQTALALLLAHALADFVAQPDAMVRRKREPLMLGQHALIHAAFALAALGGAPLLAGGVALAHLAIDAAKTWLAPNRLWAFLADQAAHLATIAAAAWLMPDAFASGLWAAAPPQVAQVAAALTGLIFATLAGGPAVGLLMAPFADQTQTEGLASGGRLIGLLERAMIVLLVLAGQPGAIGFLIAAKSILRFEMASQNRAASEYVIIGTLASFGWALAWSFLTLHAVESLAALP